MVIIIWAPLLSYKKPPAVRVLKRRDKFHDERRALSTQMWNSSWNLCDLPTCTSLSTCSAAPAVTKQKTFGFSASATKWKCALNILLYICPCCLWYIDCVNSSEDIFLNSWIGVVRIAMEFITSWESVSVLSMCKGGSSTNILIITMKARWICILFQQDSDKVENRSPASTLWSDHSCTGASLSCWLCVHFKSSVKTY